MAIRCGLHHALFQSKYFKACRRSLLALLSACTASGSVRVSVQPSKLRYQRYTGHPASTCEGDLLALLALGCRATNTAMCAAQVHEEQPAAVNKEILGFLKESLQ